MGEYRLTQEIVRLSNSKIWDQAKLEWSLDSVYEADEPDTCLCGHFPIIEICVIKNKSNENSAIVGNCCVKKFIGLPSHKIFQAMKRVRENNSKSLSPEALEHAFKKGWINGWELNFYFSIIRKRSLSIRQSHKKAQINEKIVSQIMRRG